MTYPKTDRAGRRPKARVRGSAKRIALESSSAAINISLGPPNPSTASSDATTGTCAKFAAALPARTKHDK